MQGWKTHSLEELNCEVFHIHDGLLSKTCLWYILAGQNPAVLLTRGTFLSLPSCPTLNPLHMEEHKALAKAYHSTGETLIKYRAITPGEESIPSYFILNSNSQLVVWETILLHAHHLFNSISQHWLILHHCLFWDKHMILTSNLVSKEPWWNWNKNCLQI